MARTRGVVTTADGTPFYWGPRTVVVDVSTVALQPPASTLHVSMTAAVVTPTDGGRPWRVAPHDAVALVERLNTARVAEGQPPVVLPATFRRLARHTAVAAASTNVLPWPTTEAWGYPGRTAGQVLYVHRRRGGSVLVTTPPVAITGPLSVAAAEQRTPVATRLTRRVAVAWLADNGHTPPLVLVTGAAHDTPGRGGPAGA